MTHQEIVNSLTAEKYFLGELSAAERDNFEEHYFTCPECADAVRCLGQLKAGAESEAAKRRDPAVVGGLPWSRLPGWLVQPQTGLAAAFASLVLVVMVGYQNVQLRTQLSPQTLQSVILAPATRGELAVLYLQPAGGPVLLEADVPGASGELTWSVRSRDGKILFEAAGMSPEAGSSLKILLPSSRLSPGQYALEVRSGTGREWTFRFQTAAR